MTTDIRRHWQVALAALMIWSSANFLGSAGLADDGNPPEVSDAESQAIAERLDAMLERATAQVGQHPADEDAPDAGAGALRERLEAAETQIRLLKNVVIQALRAQSAAEETLRREQAALEGAAVPEAGPDLTGSQDLMLADQLEALTSSVRRLRLDVDALLAQAPSEQTATEQDPETAVAAAPVEEAAPFEEDAMLPGSGMGGRYEPLSEDEALEGVGSETAAASGAGIEVAQVHFDLGSAQLTPGGERKTLEAVERIKSMGPAKVRVVAFTDRVGDAASNLVLSKERALSVAAVLEQVGLPRDMVEVVGRGEEGIPEPTADGVAEPLNRCAGIYVVPDSAG